MCIMIKKIIKPEIVIWKPGDNKVNPHFQNTSVGSKVIANDKIYFKIASWIIS